jgi:branched-chain amino acid transport system substrate-binding protein
VGAAMKLRCGLWLAVACLSVLTGVPATAQPQRSYGPGVTDTEIKIGNIMPYSGPASSFSILGKVEAAYFRKINDEGGINGRKINFISVDDGYSPPKAVEQARKLVESDEVLLIYSPLGTASNTAIQRYMNLRKVPQLFVASGASKWNNPKEFPWTIGFGASYFSEGRAYGAFLLKEHRDGKIAVIYQNDDLGKDVLNGLKSILGEQGGAMIVAEERFDVSEPTIDSRILTLKASGANILVDIGSPKFVAQAIKKLRELDWHPVHIVNNVNASIETVMKPAGLETSQGIVSASFTKDPADPNWVNDPEVKAFEDFLAKYYPDAGRSDVLIGIGYSSAQLLVDVLKQAGDNLTRDNVMKQATSLKDHHLPMLQPGIALNTSLTNYAPIQQLRLMRLKGERWELFGDVVNTATSN